MQGGLGFAEWAEHSTDWLFFEDAERGPDEDLPLQFEAMGQLTPEEKEVARAVLDGLLLKHAARQWGGSSPAASPARSAAKQSTSKRGATK